MKNSFLRNIWVRTIAETVWFLERRYFYPKLRKVLIQFEVPTKNEVIFDVGANRGQSAMFFRKMFPDTPIVCFEPIVPVFNSLLKNNIIKTSKFNLAIGACDGEETMYQSIFDEASTFKLPYDNSNWNNLKSKLFLVKKTEMYNPVRVTVRSLDSISKEIKSDSIFILKIDVEGHEYDVIEGASKLLEQRRIKIIQIERQMNGLRENTSSQIEKKLYGYGFMKVISIKHSIGNFFEDIYQLKS